MNEFNSNEVQDFLETTVEEDQTPQDQNLVFDPTTGELVVQSSKKGLPNPDAVVADQITEEGFFASKSFVYMYEEQIQMIYQKRETLETNTIPAIAFSFDDGEVFHVYISYPKTHFSGFPITSAIKFLPEMPVNEDGIRIANDVVNSISQHKNTSNSLIVLLAFEQEKLNHRVFITQSDGSLLEGIIKFIPQHCELYSRSKGLLETSVLDNSKVGIVGLGSGGASIAIELGKAGVGNFALIDFDRIELGNIARHVCGIGDLGRYKTKAVKDLLYGKNPYAEVETAELDININFEETKLLLRNCDLIIAATDNNRSRFNLNRIALEYKIPTIFGRVLTRACGGDILRVRPFDGPCLACTFTKQFLQSRPEEISQFQQAREETPAYVSDRDVNATVQVGLSSDIMPISNMIVKLALLELSYNKETGIKSLEEDLIADFYIWANRRDLTYKNWPKMEYGSKTPSILRWYGAKLERNLSCEICGESTDISNDSFFRQ